jgi:N-acetyl-gamma-glutamyl-phosphate reductase common form
MSKTIPAMILGGTGYVAGELLRILAQHPNFRIAGVMSDSNAGTPVRTAFPHLEPLVGDMGFVSQDRLIDAFDKGRHALFSAAPHGTSARLVNTFIGIARGRKADVTVADVSADFRFRKAAAYEGVYGHAHAAQPLLEHFACALPEHLQTTDKAHIAHPGCFATAMLLGAVPLLQLAAIEDDLYAAGVTGSTGAGRSPTPTTHHPERHSNLFAYQALGHRHGPEVEEICEQLTGQRPRLHFVPHSGPFARGIHMTLQGRLKRNLSVDGLRDLLRQFYATSSFVKVIDGMPRIKDVAGSNYAHVGVAVREGGFAVTVVIDNLIKGAAGGAVQWMNRKFGLPDETGLTTPAVGWI